MLHGLEDPAWEYMLGFQKSEDEISLNSPLMGGPIMLEKPLKRVSRPNADVRLSNLVRGNIKRDENISERKRPKYDIES